jgi:hypothetical protein
MTLYSLYIYSLLSCVINNKHVFSFNNEIHKYRTRFHSNLYVLSVNIIKFGKGAYISGIKVFNHFPQSIKILATHKKHFKSALKRRMASFGMLCHVALVRTDVSEELSASIIRATRIGKLGTLAITSNRRIRRVLVMANVVPSSLILVTVMIEALSSSETSVFTRAP